MQTPGPQMRDFEAYYAAGATWASGGDPYGHDVWRSERRIPGVNVSHDELLPFVGPPFSLPLWRAFALLNYRSAVLVWGALLVLGGAVLAFGSLALGGRARALDVLATLALGLSFGPLTSAFALGQVALFTAGAVLATLLLLRAARARWAALTAFAAALQPNLGVVLVGRLGEGRALFAVGFAALAAVGGSLAAVSAGGVARYAALLSAHTQAERAFAIQLTAGSIAYGFGLDMQRADTLQLGLSIAVAVVYAAVLLTRRYGPVERVAVGAALLPLALPFAHEHDLVLVLFAAVACLRRARGANAALAAIATLLVAVDWLGLAQRPSGADQSILLASSAAFAALALAADMEARAWLGAAAVVALVAGAAFVAHAHPLPIWPDALGAFTAGPHTDAAEVWHEENVRAGLTARNAVWSGLRALSLLGCAGLSVGALRCLRS